MLTCLVPVLFTFYKQGVLKLKNNSGAEGLKGDCLSASQAILNSLLLHLKPTSHFDGTAKAFSTEPYESTPNPHILLAEDPF